MMEKRQLGSSDLWLSRFGLGTWAIGGRDFLFNIGDQADEDSTAVVHRALELGINWFDSAPVYGLGHAEEMLAKALEGRRDQVILATKCGIVWDADRQNITGCLKAQSLRSEVEQSLRRLQTDRIDLYQIHWPNPDADLEEGWSTLADLVREGKIRYAGASNFSVAQLQRVQHIHPVASLQPPYNLFQREIEPELMAYCAAQKIGIIPYSPLRVGLLSGKFTLERWLSLPKDDWRLQYDDYRDKRFQINLAFIEKLGKVAARYRRPVSQIALAWVLRRPEITAAIVGARRPAQLEETIPAVSVHLSDADLAEIELLLSERKRALAEAGVLEAQFVEPHQD
jgi:aryl-alcohol dehydrogenase-like predicted oxidoreductase